MGLKCKFSYSGGGKLIVEGSSTVYNEALSVLKNQEQALRAWATTYTQDFQLLTGKNENTAVFDDVVRYYDSLTPDQRVLNQEELYSVKEFMTRNSFTS